MNPPLLSEIVGRKSAAAIAARMHPLRRQTHKNDGCPNTENEKNVTERHTWFPHVRQKGWENKLLREKHKKSVQKDGCLLIPGCLWVCGGKGSSTRTKVCLVSRRFVFFLLCGAFDVGIVVTTAQWFGCISVASLLFCCEENSLGSKAPGISYHQL